MNGMRQAQSPVHKTKCDDSGGMFPFSLPDDERIEDDDDADSLESLVTESFVKDEEEEEDMEPVFQLYEWLQKEQSRNPVSLLMEYYDNKAQRTRLQEKNLHIRNNIRCESVRLHETKSTTTWWRFLFECPLSGMKASSGLPHALLQKNSNSTVALAEATRHFFSAEYRTLDGYVYWDKKQAAKVSCALVAMLRLDPDRLELHEEVIPLFVTEQQVSASEVNPDEQEECFEGMDEPFPDWVHDIYNLGIRKPELSFHQESKDDPWCDDWDWTKPTRLYCKIFVRNPCPLTVCGASSTCKTQALQNAIHELQRSLDIRSVKKLWPHNATNIRKAILHALPQSTHYDNKLPSWASDPFERDSTYFLYELVLKTTSGKRVAEERIPWIHSKDECTRIGLLLPKDPLCAGDACAPYSDGIQFRSLIEDGKLASCQVELIRRRIIQSATMEGRKVSNSLRVLIAFNQLLMRWKQYGFGKQYDSPTCASPFSENDANEWSARDRSYLFVPLDSKSSDTLIIDWHCVEQTVQYRQARPLYDTSSGYWNLPFPGRIDLHFLAGIVCLLGWYATVGQDAWSAKVLSAIVLLWRTFALRREPKPNFSESVIPNRFLRHCGDLYAPHTVAKSQTVASDSKLVGFHVDMAKTEYFETKFGLDLDTATFRDYYSKKYVSMLFGSFGKFGSTYNSFKTIRRYDVGIRYGNFSMIKASRISKHADCNPMESPPPEPVYLVPELCYILPLPRDLVYILDQADSFMPFLERKIDIRRLATSALHSCLSNSLKPGTSTENEEAFRHMETFSQRFAHLLDLATTRSSVKPATCFERLEFLGDRVLAFFVALALTESYFDLSETLPALYDSLSTSTKNRSLARGALEVGLPRLILSKRCSWSSAYSYNHSQRGETIEFPDCFLSDIFEACVAASFLCSQEDDEEFIAVKTLLEMAKLPMEELTKTILFSEKKFFKSSPLGKVRGKTVKEYFSVIPPAAFEKLKIGLAKIDWELGTQFISKTNDDHSMHSLMLCSLYNAEVEYFAIYNETLCCPDLPGFEELKDTWSLLKMLNVIGCRAMQLGISSYLYQRYPHATAGDLMLLFSIVVSEDTLAYIFTKNGLHEALFDDGVADNFLEHSRRAEIIGRESWNLHGCWIVPGGKKEFQRRSLTNRDPVYIGLRGGRLCGTTKKVGPKDTTGLVFSFHALIGALVTTMGFDDAWIYLRPLFTEVMLLSPDEVREFNTSSLVENYKSGA